MSSRDEAAIANQQLWENEVRKGCGYTVPWLDLDVSVLRRYADGQLEYLPEPMTCIFPHDVLADVEGKDVLCLASGGGQQSAVFGLLGARVTVVDFIEGQLEGDRRAAGHYGYEVTAIRADMRDLSCLSDGTFDLVFQANSTAYIPDLGPVYSEVARVLRPKGVYRVVHGNPATFVMAWENGTYNVAVPYGERVEHRDDGGIEFRHYMDDIFNGLIDAGFSIRHVYEEPYARQADIDAPAGSWNHERAYVAGGFIVVARREQ
jgi:SAM-dependent methyltransferase